MKLPRPWQAISRCSEAELDRQAEALGAELQRGDWLILEGPLGAGKSTFARALIKALGATQPSEGSPTFAIAHEYRSPRGDLAHIDLYRLKSEDEIEEAGISVYFWEREMIVLVEWLSLHPGFEHAVMQASGHRTWVIRLGFVQDSDGKTDPVHRALEVQLLS